MQLLNAVHLHLVCTLIPPQQLPVCCAGALGDVFVFTTGRMSHNEAHKALVALPVLLPHAAAELLLRLHELQFNQWLVRACKPPC